MQDWSYDRKYYITWHRNEGKLKPTSVSKQNSKQNLFNWSRLPGNIFMLKHNVQMNVVLMQLWFGCFYATVHTKQVPPLHPAQVCFLSSSCLASTGLNGLNPNLRCICIFFINGLVVQFIKCQKMPSSVFFCHHQQSTPQRYYVCYHRRLNKPENIHILNLDSENVDILSFLCWI